MLSENNAYNTEIPDIETLLKISGEEIQSCLENYLESYNNCFVRPQQVKYFAAFEKGLLSNLDRKSIEPIALSFLEEKEVRGMQQFFTRSKGWDESIKACYKKQLAEQIGNTDGFLSVDESDFVKKGKDSAGVARQYCGRLGKRENCQAGVFLSYASDKGTGLVDAELYLPKNWFDDDYKERYENCQIPTELKFKTKNEMAKAMIKNVIDSGLFPIHCIGGDASFGSDHTFLDSLCESTYYFASVRENENIFREMPSVMIPENITNRGGRFKHPRSKENPIHIKTIAEDETIPWITRTISEGVKGAIVTQVKCLRCTSCRKVNRLFVPKSEIWVYIRKHEDGTIKYFVSNMPKETSLSELDKLATMRWSIEQCFQECKSYLGMTHYETRSYSAWHRHMQLVMIAQLFTTVLRHYLIKICTSYHAYGSIHYCFPVTNSDSSGGCNENNSLSVAS